MASGYDLATLALEVDSQGFVSGLQQSEQALTRFTQAVPKTEQALNGVNGAVNEFKSKLMWLAGAAGLTFGAAKMVALAREAVQLATRYQSLGVVMQQVGANVGKSAAQMRTLEESLKKQGISAADARQQLISMAQSNIDLANATKLATVAQNAAAVANTSTGEAFQRLIWGIRTGSERILRQLGLQIDMSKATEEYAKSLNKAKDALTTEELQQARVNAIMEKAKTIEGAMAATRDTAGRQMQLMKQYAQDLLEELGKFALPTLTGGLRALADGFKFLAQHSGVVLTVVAALVAKGLTPLIDRMAGAGAALVKNIGLYLAERKAIADGTAVKIGSAQADVEKAKQALNVALANEVVARSELARARATQARMSAEVGQLFAAGMPGMGQVAMTGMAEQSQQVAAAEEAVTDASNQAANAATVLGHSLKMAREEASLFGKALGFLKANAIVIAITAITYAWVKHREAVQKAQEAYEKVEGAVERQRQTLKEFAAAAAKAHVDIKVEGQEDLEKLVRVLQADAGRALYDFEQRLKDVNPAMAPVSAAVKQLWEQVVAGQLPLQTLKDYLEQLVAGSTDAAAAFEKSAPAFAKWYGIAAPLLTGKAEPKATPPTKAQEAATKALKDLELQYGRTAVQQQQLISAMGNSSALFQRVSEGIADQNSALQKAEPFWDAYQKSLGISEENTRSLSQALADHDTKAGEFYARMLAQVKQERWIGEYTKFLEEGSTRLKAAKELLDQQTEAWKASVAEQEKYNGARAASDEMHERSLQRQLETEKNVNLMRYQQQAGIKKGDPRYIEPSRITLWGGQAAGGAMAGSATDWAKEVLGIQQTTAEKAGELWLESMKEMARGVVQTFTRMFEDILTNGKVAFDSFARSIASVFAAAIGGGIGAALNTGLEKIFAQLTESLKSKGGLGAFIDKLTNNKLTFGTAAMAVLGGGTVGYASGSPLAGAAGGALAGAAGGPVGMLVGAASGIIGGILGMHKKAQEEARKLREARAAWQSAIEEWVTSVTGNDLEKALNPLRDKFNALMKGFEGTMEGFHWTKPPEDWTDTELQKFFDSFEASAGSNWADLEKAYRTYLEAVRKATQDYANAMAENANSLLAQSKRLSGDEAGAAALEMTISQWKRRNEMEERFGQLGEDGKRHLDAMTESLLTEVEALERAKLAHDQYIDSLSKAYDIAAQNRDLNTRELVAGRGGNEIEKMARDLAIANQSALDNYQNQLDAANLALQKGDITQEMFDRLAHVLGDELAAALWDAAEAAEAAALAIKRRDEDLSVRLLRAQGQGPAADAQAWALAQQREWEDAVKAGWSATALSMLHDIQVLEDAAFKAQWAFDQSQQAGAVAVRILELQGKAEEAAALQKELAVAKEKFEAKQLFDAGIITAETYATLTELLEESLKPIQEVGDALGWMSDAATSAFGNLQSLADQAMGLIGSTADQMAQYQLGLISLNPEIAEIVKGAQGIGGAADAIKNFITTNFPSPDELAAMDDQQREWWKNFMTMVAPFVGAADRWQGVLDQQAAEAAKAAEDAKKKTPVPEVYQEQIGVLVRLDALQQTANVYLSQIASNTANLGGFTVGNGAPVTMEITVNVNGVDESYGANLGNQVGGAVAASLDKKLNTRMTFNRSARGGYQPL